MSLEDKIRNEYNENKDKYKEFRDCIEKILERLFKKEYHIQPITSRIKTVDSIVNKILRPGNSYENLEDIPDIIGLRIITHFDDDVDRIGDIIRKEFKPNEEDIQDKRKTIDVDRFDYLSLHFLVTVDEERHGTQNYDDFEGMRAEIQVRSIAQHAWAEISRVLGYNTKFEVPRPVKRNFARLAGLFEIADAEFIRIRDDIDKYKKSLPNEIKDTKTPVTINNDSLKEFIKKNKIIRHLDNDIANISKCKLIDNDASIGYLVNLLEYFEIYSIYDLEAKLKKNSKLIMSFTELQDTKTMEVYINGISIYYLCYVLVSSSGSLADVESYLNEMNIGPSNKRKVFAKVIINWYKSQMKTTKRTRKIKK